MFTCKMDFMSIFQSFYADFHKNTEYYFLNILFSTSLHERCVFVPFKGGGDGSLHKPSICPHTTPFPWRLLYVARDNMHSRTILEWMSYQKLWWFLVEDSWDHMQHFDFYSSWLVFYLSFNPCVLLSWKYETKLQQDFLPKPFNIVGPWM